MTEQESDWVRIEGDQLIFTENTPEQIRNHIESLGDAADPYINFILALAQTGYSLEEYDIGDYRVVLDKVQEDIENAIEAGDVDTAQEMLQIRRLLEETSDEFFERL